jgi:hypothetical protein
MGELYSEFALFTTPSLSHSSNVFNKLVMRLRIFELFPVIWSIALQMYCVFYV